MLQVLAKQNLNYKIVQQGRLQLAHHKAKVLSNKLSMQAQTLVPEISRNQIKFISLLTTQRL